VRARHHEQGLGDGSLFGDAVVDQDPCSAHVRTDHESGNLRALFLDLRVHLLELTRGHLAFRFAQIVLQRRYRFRQSTRAR